MRLRMVLVSVLVLVAATGCNGCRNEWKHMKSETVGLQRTVTLYTAEGKTLRTWSTSSKIEDKGGTVYFLDSQGKSCTVSGTFIIEEK